MIIYSYNFSALENITRNKKERL